MYLIFSVKLTINIYNIFNMIEIMLSDFLSEKIDDKIDFKWTDKHIYCLFVSIHYQTPPLITITVLPFIINCLSLCLGCINKHSQYIN